MRIATNVTNKSSNGAVTAPTTRSNPERRVECIRARTSVVAPASLESQSPMRADGAEAGDGSLKRFEFKFIYII